MVGAASESPEKLPPSTAFGEMFDQIAQLGLVPAKDWADATPRETPQRILEAFEQAAPATPPELLDFVQTWFDLPGEVQVTCRLPTLEAQIDATWDALIRPARVVPSGSSLIPLPYLSVSPGGRFRECYYWDSYFSLIGLRHRPDVIRAAAENMRWQVQQHGFIPNGNRTYFLTRSQPPLFFKIVELLASIDGADVAAAFLPALIEEHAFWMKCAAQPVSQGAFRRVVTLEDCTELNRYWDDAATPRDESYLIDLKLASSAPERPAAGLFRDVRAACESGWDFSSRWFGKQGGLSSICTTSIIPVDLNSFLYGQEKFIAEVLRRSGRADEAEGFRSLAERRLRAIRLRLWDDTAGVFDDWNWTTDAFCGSVSAAMVAPLWMEAATHDQARQVALKVERSLMAPGGLMATTTRSGEQWDAPNGWAPLQWMAVEGLSRYGYDDLASEIRSRWVSMVRKVFGSTGRLFEKYDVVSGAPGAGGEYTIQDGFGWTNGVTKAFLDQAHTQSSAVSAP